MGFRMQITGAETIQLDENMIRTAETELFTPEESRARASKSLSTIVVTGKLYAEAEGNETMKLFNWAHVPAESKDAYRDVTLTVIFAGKTFRQVHLSKGFVVDYQERYEDTEGFGTFRLVVRQKTDVVDQVTAGGHSGLQKALGGIGSAVGRSLGGFQQPDILSAMRPTGCFGSLGQTPNTGKIMGEIAKQTAEAEAIKQVSKASPLTGQIAQTTAMVDTAMGKLPKVPTTEEIMKHETSKINMGDFIRN